MLVAGTVAVQGVDGLLLTTLMAGVILTAAGFLRLGTYIRYIPYPVTEVFTAGIASIIFASQLHDLLGVQLAAAEPAAIAPKLQALLHALPTATPAAMIIAAVTVGTIMLGRRVRPHWPNLLLAVLLLVTFGLTLFRSLAEGIGVGFALSAVLFLHRMSQSVQVDQPDAFSSGDGEGGDEDPVDRDTVVFRISGAFFFGAAATVAAALDRIAERPRCRTAVRPDTQNRRLVHARNQRCAADGPILASLLKGGTSFVRLSVERL